MYTFIISVIFWVLVSALIFGRKLQRNIFGTVVIVFFGTLISTSVVTGILQKNYSYHKTFLSERHVNKTETTINKTEKLEGYIGLNNGHLWIPTIEMGGTSVDDTTKISIIWTSDSLQMGLVQRYKETRQSNSKWICERAIPRKNSTYVVYLPDDSIHHRLVNIFFNKKRNEKAS